MNATTLRQQLANLTGISGGHKEQTDKYRAIFDQILLQQREAQIDLLKIFIESSKSKIIKKYLLVNITLFQLFFLSTVVNDQVSLVISRQILTDICTHLTKLPDADSQIIAHFLLDRVQIRVISFEEQVAVIRQHLAGIYERQEQWREAANVLGLIPLETGQR